MSPSPSGDYVFAVTDYYSRYVKISILTRNTAKVAIRSLSKMFAIHGFPYTVTSDTSSHFCGRIVWNLPNGQRNWAQENHSTLAQTNGEIESQKKGHSLKECWRHRWRERIGKRQSWNVYLPLGIRLTKYRCVIRAVVWKEVGHKTSQSKGGCQSIWGSKGQRPRHKRSRWRSVRTKCVMPMKAIWWQVTRSS